MEKQSSKLAVMGGLAGLLLLMFTLCGTAQAQGVGFNIIHQFSDGPDGSQPLAPLIIDAQGDLYGVTWYGGAYGYGTVFKMTPVGGHWAWTTLYDFGAAGPNDGYQPNQLVQDAHGVLYGTTAEGGGPAGCGTVYSLTPPPPGSLMGRWTETQILAFSNYQQGCDSLAGLTLDAAGNLYGTTTSGGSNGAGNVFKLTKSGGQWTYQNLYSFSDGGAAFPSAPVTLDSEGNLYSTSAGGDFICGSVWQITPSGGLNILHTFSCGDDGSTPYAGVILDSSGNLYGGTSEGGTAGGGVVFELSPGSDGWSFNVIYSIPGNNECCGPMSSPVMDTAGNLYVTTYDFGLYNEGSIFKLLPGPGGWTYQPVHDFNSWDGADIMGALVDPRGRVFGTASYGGQGWYNGLIFEIVR
jgi:uncharacterized repeat protein (TIGR03803 family)